MLRADELRLMDGEELAGKLRELKETLFNLRFQHATGQLENPMRIKETRREIARVCTVMTERELGIHSEAFEEAGHRPPRTREQAGQPSAEEGPEETAAPLEAEGEAAPPVDEGETAAEESAEEPEDR